MKFYMLLIFLVFLQSRLYAESKLNLRYETYDQALEAESRIFFNMSSTKAGVITTDFKGVVKEALITYSKDKRGSYRNILIIIDAKKLDTDNDARNEKMHEKCLDVKKSPKIVVSIPGPLKFGQLNKASLEVRSKRHTIEVFVEKIISAEGKVSLVGKAILSLKNLEIPDPSIWIATVHDNVEVKFYVTP